MYRYQGRTFLGMVVLLVCAASFSALAGISAAQEVTTRPAETSVRSADETPGRQVRDPDSEAGTWAKWACILAGLALVGVIWVGWSMQTLAKNQVELGKLIQAKNPAQER